MAFIMERGGRAVGIGAPPSRGSRRRAFAVAEASFMAASVVEVVEVVDVLAMVVVGVSRWIARMGCGVIGGV
jgi:hypothetical protein